MNAHRGTTLHEPWVVTQFSKLIFPFYFQNKSTLLYIALGERDGDTRRAFKRRQSCLWFCSNEVFSTQKAGRDQHHFDTRRDEKNRATLIWRGQWIKKAFLAVSRLDDSAWVENVFDVSLAWFKVNFDEAGCKMMRSYHSRF